MLSGITAITVVRTLHIISAVFWVITSTVVTLIVMPVLSSENNRWALGTRILRTGNLQGLLGISAPVAILTGVWLFVSMHGFAGDGPGALLLYIGSAAGIAAFVIGVGYILPMGLRLQRAVALHAGAGTVVDPAIAAEISVLEIGDRRAHHIMITLQWIALVGMSAFRFL